MGTNEWSFAENLQRGFLPTGESLEALYGVGWWTHIPREEPKCTQCHICGGKAYDLGDHIDCENCGIVEVPIE